ncbi:hypothetical protein CATMIT_00759 [Catenibacterium mitsuokai DSM 15897]|nr:hypothetical protein CATMIT_00759 [Catenibacterium mitsuokai DSM 15897]
MLELAAGEEDQEAVEAAAVPQVVIHLTLRVIQLQMKIVLLVLYYLFLDHIVFHVLKNIVADIKLSLCIRL